MKKVKRVVIGILIAIVVAFGGLMVWARIVKAPHLGVSLSGILTELPDSPNAVSTQTEDASRRMDPLPYRGTYRETRAALLEMLESMPEVTIIADRPDLSGYIRTEFRTKLLGFVDDVEFVFDHPAKVVHFRSSSRVGYSDLGANRKRMESVREMWERL